MRPRSNKQSETGAVIVAAMKEAHEAELQGKPKQWFILQENPRGGLKLGIGMFNPGIERVAELCYVGEPSEVVRTNARLIVAAVNACFAVNRYDPIVAAKHLPALVTEAEAVIRLRSFDQGHVAMVRSAIEALGQAYVAVKGAV